MVSLFQLSPVSQRQKNILTASLLCRSVRLHYPTSVLDRTLNHPMVMFQSRRLGETRRTPLLTLLQGPHRHAVESPDRLLFMGQIERFDH